MTDGTSPEQVKRERLMAIIEKRSMINLVRSISHNKVNIVTQNPASPLDSSVCRVREG